MGNQGLTDRNGSTTEENEYARAKLYHKNMATVELFVFLFAPLINRIKVGTFIVDIIYFFLCRAQQYGCPAGPMPVWESSWKWLHCHWKYYIIDIVH